MLSTVFGIFLFNVNGALMFSIMYPFPMVGFRCHGIQPNHY